MKKKYIFNFSQTLCVLFVLGVFLLIWNWWRIGPYFALEHVKLPPGSKVVEHTNIHWSDANWEHIYGVKAVHCPLPYEQAEVWVRENNDLSEKIGFLQNGAMSSDRDYYYGETGESDCYIILRYYEKPSEFVSLWNYLNYVFRVLILLILILSLAWLLLNLWLILKTTCQKIHEQQG